MSGTAFLFVLTCGMAMGVGAALAWRAIITGERVAQVLRAFLLFLAGGPSTGPRSVARYQATATVRLIRPAYDQDREGGNA